MSSIRTRSTAKATKFSALQSLVTASAVLLSLTFAGNAIAEYAKGAKGMSRETTAYDIPENLSEMPTTKVSALLESRQHDLYKLESGESSIEKAEAEMLEVLLDHDLVRMSIKDIIPDLVNEYGLEGDFKDSVLGFGQTFTTELMPSREDIHNLRDYQSYDFRFAAIYMSMLYSFQQNPEFYEQLKVDMKDPSTTIGAYRKTMDDSYLTVAEARKEMELVYNEDKIELLVQALDQELSNRQK